MTSKPPVPERTKSTYPIAEAAHDQEGEGEAMAIVKEITAAKKRRLPNGRQIGMGAAIGIGSAAIVASLLYWRGGRKDRK